MLKGSTNMKAFLIASALAVLIPATAVGQTIDHSKMMHGMMMGVTLPQETGQSAFAAIQEIVGMLNADPATDWTKVNIEALRQHLIDMNNVTLDAMVESKQRGNSMQFVVSGEGAIQASIKRMVTAHVATMNGVDGWKIEAKPSDTGAVMTVTPPNSAAMSKLRALGFIGFMTLGMHHQQHHWMLANGMSPHG
jgi:hypothetical protein